MSYSVYIGLKSIMTPLEAIMKMKAAFEAAGLQFAPGDPMPAPAPEVAPAADPAVEPTEAAKEYELKAGGKVMIDSLEIGGKVTILDEAGNEAPAPAGDHELIDGTTITVDETGTITAVNAPAEAAPEVEVEIEPAAPSEAEMKIAALEQAIAELKKDAEAKKAMMSEVEAKFSKAISEMSDVIVGLINTPSASATENPKDKFNAHMESKEEKI
jgi:hypothetical protein